MSESGDFLGVIRKLLGETFQVKLAPGVVGNTSKAIFGLFVAVALISYSPLAASPAIAFWTIGLLVLAFCLLCVGSWFFAHKNPGPALLAGASLERVLGLQLAAKNVPEVPEMQAIDAPSELVQLPASEATTDDR